MLIEIIRKEILDHLLGLRFAITMVLCLTVVLSGLLIRTIDFGQDMNDFAQNSATDRQKIESQRHPWGLFQLARIHLPPNPLKVFVRGTQDQNGGILQVSPTSKPAFIVNDILNTSAALFPFLDLIFFIGIIMSLMGIVFGYDAICGEKEQGTLRLMLSFSIPRDTVLLGKWIGGFIVLILPYLISCICMIAIVLIQPGIAFSSAQWLRVLLILSLGILYISAIYSMSLWISTITAKPATSIICLITLWVALVLAIPNTSSYIAGFLTRPPDSEGFEKQRQAFFESAASSRDKVLSDWRKARGWPDNWWTAVQWNIPDSAKVGIVYYLLEEETGRDLSTKILGEQARLDEEYNRETGRQIRVGKWIARVSPFGSFVLASSKMANEGVEDLQILSGKINEHNRNVTKYIWDEMVKCDSLELMNRSERPEYSKIRKPFPAFAHMSGSAIQSLLDVIVDAGLLIFATIFFFMLSFVSFLRYDVR